MSDEELLQVRTAVDIHGVGIYLERFFEGDYFSILTNEHAFQPLTESNKPSLAYRTGVYLSDVHEWEEGLEYNLLRCSTNFKGPTENFSVTDQAIIAKVNSIREHFFDDPATFNHVLAQVYTNYKIDGKDKRAKIKRHSDKTKDMPDNGLIAFCTFYSQVGELEENSLTKLRFRLKESYCGGVSSLNKLFDVTLHPNSVFIISLATNRLYTHEIVPPSLPVEKIPVRMGYVIRCSKTKAMFQYDGGTYVGLADGGRAKLEKPTDADIVALKKLYSEENVSCEKVNYGDILFSMNDGDYLPPRL